MKTTRMALAVMAISAAASLQAQSAPAAGDKLVCGGVGNDERRELATEMRGANVSLEFSLAGRGNYVSDGDVTLTPQTGAGEALRVRTDGPICYLRLPPGRYRVEAAYNGTTKSTAAVVPASGKPVHVAMAFPPTAADIDPAPVSPEEKLQASKP
ncbi:MAG: hypothetical protein ACXWBQ_15605 [Usitatibacter sp.]